MVYLQFAYLTNVDTVFLAVASLTTGEVADAVVITSGPMMISSDDNKSSWHIIVPLSVCLSVVVVVIIVFVTIYL